MHRPTFHKPELKLERRLFVTSALESALVIGYALLLFAVPLLAYVGLAEHGTAWALGALPLLIPAAYGMFLQGILGHEGFHFNFSEKRLLSCLLGVLCSSILTGFCVTGYFVDHWQHHRHSNGPQDPDWRLFRRYRHPLMRMIVSRLQATARYLLQTVQLALPGARVEGRLPLPAQQIRLLARVNLLCQAGWIVLWAGLASHWPVLLPALVVCLLLALLISGVNAYQEHAFASDVETPIARSRTSLLCSLLHAGSNYHLEHHLYPRVPCWRLPQVHRRLLASGWYQDRQTLLEPSFIGSFRYCSSQFPYSGELQATPELAPASLEGSGPSR
ncbi:MULTISPECIES: fatty acid desaturase family protein [Pseudomonas]|uniref:Fatty acid desaturase domain-containing protein n=1 Tax=Pseudomonas fluorescens TaxID=294 RepID=A0A5E6WW27_PSEFL|nr:MULTISPECIES: fatty acid desaturase [Pseudomonas]VVN32427.1 hypothetical protein PS652_04920 [Pseudomonas fluorescens]